MSFDGQRVIIVGGSAGIGEAAARAFAAAGAQVTITGRAKPRLDAAAQRIGHPVQVRELDATDGAAVTGFFSSAPAFDHLVLVASPGAVGSGPFAAVAYTLYFRGLRSAAASTAALLTLLEPLIGAILAAVVLAERLSATGIAGAAIIASAVIVTVRANRGHPEDVRAPTAGRPRPQNLSRRLSGRVPPRQRGA